MTKLNPYDKQTKMLTLWICSKDERMECPKNYPENFEAFFLLFSSQNYPHFPPNLPQARSHHHLQPLLRFNWNHHQWWPAPVAFLCITFATLKLAVLPLPLVSFHQLFPAISWAYTLQSTPPAPYLLTIFVIVEDCDEWWIVEHRWVHQNGMYEQDEGPVRIVWEGKSTAAICWCRPFWNCSFF